MRATTYILACIALLASIAVGHATLSRRTPLSEAVAEASWILHVRVKEIEEPFGADNEHIRIGLCEVLEIIKADTSGDELLLPAADEIVAADDAADPFDAPETKWKTVMVSLLKRRDLSPVEEGQEYIFLCQKATLIAAVVGEARCLIKKDTEGKS